MTSARDNYRLAPATWVAGSSDVGLRHGTNQDAMSLAVRENPRQAVIVVADGVSTAFGSEAASLAAVEACGASLSRSLEQGPPGAPEFGTAFTTANDAVFAIAGQDEPSACTLIAAVVSPGAIIVGNVGDSRAYWIGDDGASLQLTADDSMAAARMMMGMTREEAENSHQAHAILRWLGRGTPDVTPTMNTLHPDGAGWLLVCTDGLWNYASAPEDLARVFHGVAERNDHPAEIADGLVTWANEQGGKDNVTVVVVRC